MRQVATLIVVAAVLAVPQAAAKEPLAPTTVWGVTWDHGKSTFAELDALTLQSVSKSVELGEPGWYLGRSVHAGYRVALVVGQFDDAIRFVDVSTMRMEKRVQLPCRVERQALWEVANRLILTCSSSASSVLVVDPVKQKLVARKALRGELGDVEVANGLLVGVLAPLGTIGEARLVTVTWSGLVRIGRLPGVQAGMKVLDQSTYHARIERPAVAIEPTNRRAAIVPADGPVTIVDLSTLATTKYAARAPAAVRKNIEGSERTAIWTWANTIAVGGVDWTADGQPDHTSPSGLRLIDVTSWTSRTLDQAAPAIVSTNPGGILLASGSVWDPAAQRSIGYGLTGYSTDGTMRFHLFGSESVGVAAIAGTYAYIPSADYHAYRIVDTMTGTVVRTVETALPTALYATQPGF